MLELDDASRLIGGMEATIGRLNSSLDRMEDRLTKLEGDKNRAWGVLIGVGLISGSVGAFAKSLLSGVRW